MNTTGINRQRVKQCLQQLGSALVLSLVTAVVCAQTAESVRFYDFAVVELQGRPEHQGFTPIQGQPISGASVLGRARLLGEYLQANFQLVDASGEAIGDLPLESTEGDAQGTFYGPFVIPDVPFSVVAIVTDLEGTTYSLQPDISPIAVPTSVQLELTPAQGLLSPGTRSIVYATVTNHGPSDSFDLRFTDDANGITSPTSFALALQSGATETVQLTLMTPDSMAGEAIEIHGEVSSTSNSSISNSALRRFRVDDVSGHDISADIRPGSCKNPLSKKSKGVLPVAIYSSSSFDAATIDSSSIRLAGLVLASKVSLEDVGGGAGETCNKQVRDGRLDLVLHFDNQAVLSAMDSLLQADVGADFLSVPLDGSTGSNETVVGWDQITVVP